MLSTHKAMSLVPSQQRGRERRRGKTQEEDEEEGGGRRGGRRMRKKKKKRMRRKEKKRRKEDEEGEGEEEPSVGVHFGSLILRAFTSWWHTSVHPTFLQQEGKQIRESRRSLLVRQPRAGSMA